MHMLLNSTLVAAVTLSAAAAIAFGDAAKADLAVALPPGANLPVVQSIDLQRYSGTWYEQARLPNRFQKACAASVVANYTVQADGGLRVVNRCVNAEGVVVEAIGEGRRVSVAGGPQGQLEVRFAPRWLSWLSVVWGDYWVIGLDDRYEVSLVGTPDREYLWLLSRDRQLPPMEIKQWLQKAAALGFPVDKVMGTAQPEQAASLP